MGPYLLPVSSVVLLVVELLGLTFAFDTQRLDTVDSFWAQLVAWSPQALRLASSITVAAVALIALARPTVLRMLNVRPDPGRRLAAISIHVLAGGLFTWITSVIVAVGATYSRHAALWTLAWFFSGTTTISAWALFVLPPRGWRVVLANTRTSVLAGAVVGTIGWAFGFVTQEFWIPVSRCTFRVVTWMLGFFYTPMASGPEHLWVGTTTFRIRITPQCSGYEGVGLIVAFLTMYLWFYRKELRFPRALILLPAGAIAVWLANAVRIVALILLGTAGWRDIATGGFHSQAGWILFNAIALGFVALTNRATYFHRAVSPAVRDASLATNPESDQITAYLGPFIVITATAMVTGLFSSGFDWLYPFRILTVGSFLWVFRNHYLAQRWSWSWSSLGIGFVTFVVWIALAPTSGAQNGGWPAALRSVPVGWAAAWFFFRSFGYVIMTPLAEELAFRGFLTRRLAGVDSRKPWLVTFSWWALVVSSLVFGLLHGNKWLPATLAGLSFGLALYRRGVLGDAVWAHATTNGLLALYACATGQWSVWS